MLNVMLFGKVFQIAIPYGRRAERYETSDRHMLPKSHGDEAKTAQFEKAGDARMRAHLQLIFSIP